VGHIACKREIRNGHKVLVGKPDGKRPLGRPRGRWDDNIIIYHAEIDWKVVDWMHLAQERDQCGVFVNTVMSPRLYKKRRIS
jgi:hypothetical protein